MSGRDDEWVHCSCGKHFTGAMCVTQFYEHARKMLEQDEPLHEIEHRWFVGDPAESKIYRPERETDA